MTSISSPRTASQNQLAVIDLNMESMEAVAANGGEGGKPIGVQRRVSKTHTVLGREGGRLHETAQPDLAIVHEPFRE
jgi:hypothetical protein